MCKGAGIRFGRLAAAAGRVAGAVCVMSGAPAGAGEEDKPRLAEFSGVDVTANSRFGYAGGVWTFGRGVEAPGWRLRALGGYGAYVYDGTLAFPGGTVPMRFNGEVPVSELLAGRLWRQGEWTFKAYGGVQYIEHAVTPGDPANSVTGAQWGAKGLVEVWRDLGSRAWFAADGAYGTAFDEYRLKARLGRRLTRRVSLGLEAGGFGNAGYDSARGGAFARLHLGGTDITVSGGVSGDYRGEASGGYIALELYRKR